MTDVHFADPSGATITLKDLNGRYILSPGTWESILNMQTRSDDVFVCSYPKSGSHWLYEIVTMLRRRDASPITDQSNTIDFKSAAQAEATPPPRVFVSHRYYDELPVKAREDRCKLVYVLRDPKDVCVSFYNHMSLVKAVAYDGKMEGFVHLFADGKVPFNSWWEHVMKWSRVQERCPDQPLLVLYYEDLKKNPEAGVRRLAEFLEVEADDTLIRDIVRNTSFENMKKHKESLDFHHGGRYKTEKNFFYRKGEVGDSKNWLTEHQWEEMLTSFRTKLESNVGVLESVRSYLY